MAHVHFPVGTLARLVEHTLSSPEHVPTFGQMHDGRVRHDGQTYELGELSDWGAEDVDFRRVPPSLAVVCADGIFLMSTGWAGPPSCGFVRAFAFEADPRKGDRGAVDDARRAIYGSDDRTYALGPSFLRYIVGELAEASRDGLSGESLYFALDVGPDHRDVVDPSIVRGDELGADPTPESRMPEPQVVFAIQALLRKWPDEREEPHLEYTTMPEDASPSPRIG